MATLDSKVLSTMSVHNRRAVKAASKIPRSQWTAAQKTAMKVYNQRKGSGTTTPPKNGGSTNPAQTTPPAMKDWLSKIKEGGSYESLLSDPQKLEKYLALAGYQGSLDEMLREAVLHTTFGGVNQWRENLSGDRNLVESDKRLQNVSMGVDLHSLRRILGQIQEELMRGRDPSQLMQGRDEFVPDWATSSFDKLVTGGNILDQIKAASERKSGLNWSLDLLSSPEINLLDPSKPLFDPRTNPTSLNPLTGGGQGERSFYSTLSAQEFMENILPIARSYLNRGAGEAAPFSGLTFGSMTANPNWNTVGSNWVAEGTPMYEPHPIRESDLYNRWTAWGQPGNSGLPDNPYEYEGIRSSLAGRSGQAIYNPFTNTGTFDYQGGGPSLIGSILSGQTQPSHFAGQPQDWNSLQDLILSLFGRNGAAAFLQDPSIHFTGPWEPYHPNNMDPLAIQRMLEILSYGGGGGV